MKRIPGDNAVPIQVVPREAIVKSGVTTAADLLDKLVLNVGGYNLSIAIGDPGKPGFSGVSLRGLGQTRPSFSSMVAG